MSMPGTAQHIWTREELSALKQPGLRVAAKNLGLSAGGKNVEMMERILEFQRSNLVDAVPSPEPSPELLPEPSSALLPEPSPELSPEPPQESRPSHPAVSVYEDPGKMVISPSKAGSLGSNPSQDSASSRHLSLGTNTSPRKDKGKGKATETADAEQLKGSSGEFSGSHTNILLQADSTMAGSSERKKKRRPKKPPQSGESSLPRNPEPNQNNDSQERFQVQQIVLVSDNSGSSLNSNRTISSIQSFHASFDSRLRKLETSASVESVRTDLHKELESLKSELGAVKEENARMIQLDDERRKEITDIRKENADLKVQVSAFTDRLALIEELLMGKPPAHSSNSSSTDLEGESAPRLVSPQPIDEAKTPQPDTTPKAHPRHLEGLEVASSSEHTAPRDSNAPLSLPAFSLLPPPNGTPGPGGQVETRPTSRPGSHTPSGSRQYQPSSTPSGSYPLESSKKRKLEEPEPGPSVASDVCVPSKRVRPNGSPGELLEDPASLQRERRGGEAVRGAFTTPPNPSPPNPPPAHALNSRHDYPFRQGSPSPLQRPLPRTPATQNPRHRVSSPSKRPETQSPSTQLITPLVGEVIPSAPLQVVAVPVRGDDARRTPEPTSSRTGLNHMIGSSTLASAVGGVFNPPSSSTPARPRPSSLVMRTSTATSRPVMGAWPYERPPLINATAPAPPAISAAGPPTERHDSGGSQSSDGTNSDRAEGANQVPSSPPVEAVSESVRIRMPPVTGAQPSGALDPFQFTGAVQRLRGYANPSAQTTPDSSMRQVAPETPMASPTRYGTEINPSMRHLY